MVKSAKNISDDAIWQQRVRVAELEDEYAVQLYFETMPAYDPLYKYCYQTSNMKIPAQYQSIDYWIRAVIKHMGLRHKGHGGANTKAILLSIPDNMSQANKDKWLAFVTNKISKIARVKK